MAKVDESNWICVDGSLAEIVVSFQGPGALGRVSVVSVEASDLSPAAPIDHTAEAHFTVTPDAHIRFLLHLFCELGAASDVYLAVSQNGVILECRDDAQTVLNRHGAKFKALKIDTLSQGDDAISHFNVIKPLGVA